MCLVVKVDQELPPQESCTNGQVNHKLPPVICNQPSLLPQNMGLARTDHPNNVMEMDLVGDSERDSSGQTLLGNKLSHSRDTMKSFSLRDALIYTRDGHMVEVTLMTISTLDMNSPRYHILVKDSS